MADKTTLNITGTSGRTYNLDEIEADNRTNAAKPLVVQVYKYVKGQDPNPSDLTVGQIWLSKQVVVASTTSATSGS
jgi:hypothetical protein